MTKLTKESVQQLKAFALMLKEVGDAGDALDVLSDLDAAIAEAQRKLAMAEEALAELGRDLGEAAADTDRAAARLKVQLM